MSCFSCFGVKYFLAHTLEERGTGAAYGAGLQRAEPEGWSNSSVWVGLPGFGVELGGGVPL